MGVKTEYINHPKINIPNQGFEFHYPLQNYMGPGTHVYDRIQQRKLPQSKEDCISLIHDLDYMAANTLTQLDQADNKAIKQTDNSVKSISMIVGLNLRKTLGLDLRGYRPNTAKLLKYEISRDPDYIKVFKQYGVKIE